MFSSPRLDREEQNFILNANCRYFQEGGINSAVSHLGLDDYISADQFLFGGTANALENQRSTDTPSGEHLMTHSIRMGIDVSTPASDNSYCKQYIESIFASRLAANQSSVGVRYKSNNAQTLEIAVMYANIKDDFSATTDIVRQEITIQNDGAWHTAKIEDFLIPFNAVNGLVVYFNFKNFAGSTTDDHLLTGFQLNRSKTLNSVFNLFGVDEASELNYLRRYFEKSYDIDVEPGTVTTIGEQRMQIVTNGSISTNYNDTRVFKSTKMQLPLITTYNPFTGSLGQFRHYGRAVNRNSNTPVYIGTNDFTRVFDDGGSTNDHRFGEHFVAKARL